MLTLVALQSRRAFVLVVLSVLGGCYAPVEEVAEADSGTERTASLAVEPPVTTCSGSSVRVAGLADAQARLQGRWRRCGEPQGRLDEAPPFVKEVVAFEVENDEWFSLVQGDAGDWRRLTSLELSGTLEWWSTGNVGVSFRAGTRFTPAIVAFSTAGVRLDLYPGVALDFVPLR